MQSPTRVVCRDRYDIESLTQKQPHGFKPTFLNAAAASGVKSIARPSLAPERGQLCPREPFVTSKELADMAVRAPHLNRIVQARELYGYFERLRSIFQQPPPNGGVN
jgi:hypothetical protein